MASLALLCAAASGCGLPEGYGGGTGSYYNHSSHHRRDSHRHSSPPPKVHWSQPRLQQHWREQAQKVR